MKLRHEFIGITNQTTATVLGRRRGQRLPTKLAGGLAAVDRSSIGGRSSIGPIDNSLSPFGPRHPPPVATRTTRLRQSICLGWYDTLLRRSSFTRHIHFRARESHLDPMRWDFEQTAAHVAEAQQTHGVRREKVLEVVRTSAEPPNTSVTHVPSTPFARALSWQYVLSTQLLGLPIMSSRGRQVGQREVARCTQRSLQ